MYLTIRDTATEYMIYFKQHPFREEYNDIILFCENIERPIFVPRSKPLDDTKNFDLYVNYFQQYNPEMIFDGTIISLFYYFQNIVDLKYVPHDVLDLEPLRFELIQN